MDPDQFNDADRLEDEHDEQPSTAQKLVGQLQAAVDWYGINVQPYVQAVKAPMGYLLWCVVTAGLIAGLPTAKAISSDPYTELSVLVQTEIEREQERIVPTTRPQRR
jgi:hypothetical protein